ncbi:regulatory protein TetR [Beutenbergia cavernae DSM 12333]|uniref:Regulatory protein TetR n=1 Tax=Beutenbergia cavernae (strain ATCC BAA-8 / DSM 12333 / CCUG 43141 / JCM 11478 / NBRC 16432 / NCIMB 13614 / HKI 0122) TaxID=471853 RepID=C5BVP8_BEUC1|nr:TetR/AcrR family transcriptional regulator [Beutenbergia cavernae]ACQ78488.1 regulatory protein TetR [Beutenbergia cavernae DSM 12333]
MSDQPTRNEAGRRARERLVDAAERLVATRGPEVPVRQITRAAGQRNNSAVTYHFGSRAGLLDAVWTRRTQRVNADRSAMMDELAADGRDADLHALVEAHVLPMAREIGAGLPSYWARFNEVTLAAMPLAFLDTFDADLAQRVETEVPLRTLSDLFHRMRKHVADGAEPAAGLQVALMVRFVIAALASWERDQEAGRVDAASLEEFAHGLVELGHEMLVHPNRHLADAVAHVGRA